MRLPVTLTLQPSRRLAAALVVAHGLVAASLAPTNLPLSMKFLCIVVLALSLAISLRREMLRPALVTLTLEADGRLKVGRPDGTCAEAQVHPQTTAFSWLIVLLLKIEGRGLALTLPVDALGAESHRQLRLWLRWKAATR